MVKGKRVTRDRADTADCATRTSALAIRSDDPPARRPSSTVGTVGKRLGAALTLAAGLAAAAFVSLISTATSAMAATALIVSGIGTPVYPDLVLSWALNGKFNGVDPVSGTPWERMAVPWPAQSAPFVGWVSLGTSVAVGTNQLHAQVLATPGAKTVVGVSAGTLVVDEAMRRLADDPTAPSKDELNFVVIGAGTQSLEPSDDPLTNLFRTLSGYTFKAPPETLYDLSVVTAEYDGFADFPDRWWNVVASANALAGMLITHAGTYFADLSAVPDEDITTTINSAGGVTTTYLMRANELPLVTVFPGLAPIESTLKELVDAGYSRNDADAVSAASVVATAAQAGTRAPAARSLLDALKQASHEPIRETFNRLVNADANRNDTSTNPDADDPSAATKVNPAASTANSHGYAPALRSQPPTREARPAAQPNETLTKTATQSTGPAQSPSRQHPGSFNNNRHSSTRPYNPLTASDDAGQPRTTTRGDLRSRARATEPDGGDAKSGGASTTGKRRADRDSGETAPKRHTDVKRSEQSQRATNH